MRAMRLLSAVLFARTVTAHEAVLKPSMVVTVITALPALMAVTTPSLLTEATAGFEEVQKTS
ncbi:MAG: hypothetical protein BWY37_01165 [Firmicutes bacterium ADurb.Bin262]|nr:MAG: hypothetical protein BWY37_01165 [Firmicutes bacterium ADurb.Bin262]